jgi:hypothetical protein
VENETLPLNGVVHTNQTEWAAGLSQQPPYWPVGGKSTVGMPLSSAPIGSPWLGSPGSAVAAAAPGGVAEGAVDHLRGREIVVRRRRVGGVRNRHLNVPATTVQPSRKFIPDSYRGPALPSTAVRLDTGAESQWTAGVMISTST